MTIPASQAARPAGQADAQEAPWSAVVGALSGGLPLLDPCIKCGACLPACPTYEATRLERESPRGRVQLIRAVGQGLLAPDDYFLHQMYDCLDCRACETACPVGIPIGSMILEARGAAQDTANPDRRSGWLDRATRSLLHRQVFGHPRRMEIPLVLTRWLYQRTGLQRLVRATRFLAIAPPLRRLEAWLPELADRPWRWRYSGAGERIDPVGPTKLRAAFFLGCFMNAVFADASAATAEVVRRNGVEIRTPRGLVCCGAPQTDAGEFELARQFARTNIVALEATESDVVFADCAACSGMLKEYGSLLSGDPDWADRARAITAKAVDFSELMRDLIPTGPPLGPIERDVTYHEPCHLAHAQKVTTAPREVLTAIPGLRLLEMADSNACCGSAGVYNFRRPTEADVLLDRKVAAAGSTGADIVMTANPGCMGQIEMGLRRSGSSQRVRHLSQLLLEAYDVGCGSSEPTGPATDGSTIQ